MIERSDVGRFVITGLQSTKDMIQFEQEVTEATFVLDAAEATEEGAAVAKYYTPTGKYLAASLAAGELVDKAILGPEIVEQMRGARRFGFSTFVLCGFLQTMEQLRFFESQMACKSEALVLDYPRAHVMERARAGVDGSAQEVA